MLEDTFSKSAVEHGILQRNEKITLSCDLTEDGCINNSGVPGPSKKMDIRRLLKPTKQWLLKQGFVRETCEFNENVESIAKLHTPTWRLNLRD
ncbi:jg1283 [Pararge aegeria aegeria]|uniref:Jg1283 protein n=2 Tax=Pararge aegeria TaxID=116150 RepID=A0A8S4RDQ3_9NEOP|nr:jg1283 [Pararge aegeria aegeria]